MMSNSKIGFTKFAFYVLLALTLLTGYLLIDIMATKASMVNAEGRVVRWEGDDVVLKFASPGTDSLIVKTKVSYTKNKNVLNAYEIVPVRFSPRDPSKFEVEGVRGNSIAGIAFGFLFFLIGLISASINLVRTSRIEAKS